MASRVLSLVLHVGAASSLVLLGVRPHARAPEERSEHVTFLQVSEAPPPPPPALARPPEASSAPKGFQTLTAPASIANQVPAPESTATVEADYSGQGVEGGLASNVSTTTPSAQPTTYELSEVSVAPRMTRVVTPEYSSDIASMGIHGTVLIRVDVLPSGDPDGSSVMVIRPLNPILDDAAVRALLKSRFSPGCIGSRAVRVAVIVPYTFGSR